MQSKLSLSHSFCLAELWCWCCTAECRPSRCSDIRSRASLLVSLMFGTCQDHGNDHGGVCEPVCVLFIGLTTDTENIIDQVCYRKRESIAMNSRLSGGPTLLVLKFLVVFMEVVVSVTEGGKSHEKSNNKQKEIQTWFEVYIKGKRLCFASSLWLWLLM